MNLGRVRLGSAGLAAVLGVVVSQMMVVSSQAQKSPDVPGQLSAADYKFATEAARGGAMEVQLGKLAADRSADPAVKQFGQQMVDDHGKASQQLTQIASQKGASLPTDLTSEQSRHFEQLNKLTGPDFDRAYISMMIRDHKTDVKEFERAAEKSRDADLRSFAATTLPVIQHHLSVA